MHAKARAERWRVKRERELEGEINNVNKSIPR